MQINIDISNIKSIINDKFYPLLTNKNRYLVLRGSAGSGKSHFAVIKILIRILVGMSDGTKHKFLCVRKTQPAIKRSVWALLKHYINEWNLEPLCKINNTDMTIQWVNGSVIMCIGLDQPEKIKSIEGITSIFCEEATELTEQDVMQLDLRLRGEHKAYHQIVFAFNPVGRNNYIYKMFYEKEHEDTLLHHSTFLDNKFLDDKYATMLNGLKKKDYNMWLIYCKGDWGELKNLIYTNWDEIEVFPTPERTIYGCDFGFNSETAIIELGLREEGVYVKERLYRSGMTNNDLINWIKKNIPDAGYIYADTSEPARIAEMRREGINAQPSDKSVKDGLDFVKRQNLYITSNSINIIKEIQTYKYKEDRTGLVLDEPVKAFDHAMDAIRYALYTHLGNKMDLTFITSGD